MPGKNAQERAELSRVGGYAKSKNPQKEKAARARLAALQARRRLVEAAEAAAVAEAELRAIGDEEPVA
jgi:hypothetical protein